jgi:aryl-alcohol dehydrogenase-like predicted oxidoreductase
VSFVLHDVIICSPEGGGDMRNRTLGSTGYEVSEIGFGAWGIGADMWRGVGDTEASDALRAAVDTGVNFFDTALVYGSGHSESLIGRVLRDEIRDGRVIVATKVPPLNEEWPGSGSRTVAETFPAAHLATCVEESLANLDIDALSLQQLHVWHDAWLDDPEWADSRERMVRLKEEGKVLHWGISINDHASETALRALADPVFETAQVIYNIYDRSPEVALFELARTKPLGVIVRVPFDEGALTGNIRSDTVFPPGDWREEYFCGDRPAEAQRRAGALARLLDDEVETLPELALRFCLSRPEVSTVIPGMRRAEHVRANVAASEKGPLPPEMLSRLEEHAWDKNWYPA